MSALLVRQVEDHLRGCLPPDVPPSYRAILGARIEGKGKERQIVADLLMFDGLPAVVTLSKWAFGWSHRFHMSSAVYWEDGRWHREPVDHPDLFSPSGRYHAAGGAA